MALSNLLYNGLVFIVWLKHLSSMEGDHSSLPTTQNRGSVLEEPAHHGHGTAIPGYFGKHAASAESIVVLIVAYLSFPICTSRFCRAPSASKRWSDLLITSRSTDKRVCTDRPWCVLPELHNVRCVALLFEL